MRLHLIMIVATCVSLCTACKDTAHDDRLSLREELYELIDTVPGTVGIAYVSDTDTITVNNGVKYPMMSVFKFHQALAVACVLEKRGHYLDSTLFIHADELDRDTWSPMLINYSDADFSISVAELLKYSITLSDNNASNLLFKHIVTPTETDEFVRHIAKDCAFQISCSESEMKDIKYLCYSNYSSPLSAALLMRQIFEESLVGGVYQDSIKRYLSEVSTGVDRLGAAVADSEMAIFAHKTGSGYRNEAGELTAHNDIGYFLYRDGRNYSLAVFIRDFRGSEQEASTVIANISKCVYKYHKNR